MSKHVIKVYQISKYITLSQKLGGSGVLAEWLMGFIFPKDQGEHQQKSANKKTNTTSHNPHSFQIQVQSFPCDSPTNGKLGK